MPTTAGDVFASVRSLVEDMEQDYATDDYLIPKLQTAQNRLSLALYSHPNIGKYKAMVVLPSVAIGSTSLKDYFATGKPLELLDEVLSLKEKAPSDGDQFYMVVTEQTVPPTVVQGPYNRYFTFTGDDLILPGATQALTLRIWGAFRPAKIQSKDSAIMPGTLPVLEFITASLAAKAHGNQQMAKDYADEGQSSLDMLINNIILELQTQPSRPRGYSESAPLPVDSMPIG